MPTSRPLLILDKSVIQGQSKASLERMCSEYKPVVSPRCGYELLKDEERWRNHCSKLQRINPCVAYEQSTLLQYELIWGCPIGSIVDEKATKAFRHYLSQEPEQWQADHDVIHEWREQHQQHVGAMAKLEDHLDKGAASYLKGKNREELYEASKEIAVRMCDRAKMQAIVGKEITVAKTFAPADGWYFYAFVVLEYLYRFLDMRDERPMTQKVISRRMHDDNDRALLLLLTGAAAIASNDKRVKHVAGVVFPNRTILSADST